MAQGQRPQYDVFVSREIEAGKNFYTKIGSAWNVSKDGISITIDATPVDGRMVLFPGLRDTEAGYPPGYYAAFVLDPDDNNIEAVFRS